MVSSSKNFSSKPVDTETSVDFNQKDNPTILESWRVSPSEFAILTDDGVLSFVDVGEDD